MPIRNFLFFISVIGDFRFSKFISNITVFSQSSKPVWKNRPKSATFRHGPTPLPPLIPAPHTAKAQRPAPAQRSRTARTKSTLQQQKGECLPFRGHSPFVLPTRSSGGMAGSITPPPWPHQTIAEISHTKARRPCWSFSRCEFRRLSRKGSTSLVLGYGNQREFIVGHAWFPRWGPTRGAAQPMSSSPSPYNRASAYHSLY